METEHRYMELDELGYGVGDSSEEEEGRSPSLDERPGRICSAGDDEDERVYGQLLWNDFLGTLIEQSTESTHFLIIS